MISLMKAFIEGNVKLCDKLLEDGTGKAVDSEYSWVFENKISLFESPEKLSRDQALKLSDFLADGYKDFDKTTPMFWAIKFVPSLVQKLFDASHRKDLFVENVTGMTALMWAVVLDNVSVVEVLLNNSVNLYAKNFYGVRALDLAIAGNHPRMVRSLVTYGTAIDWSVHPDNPLTLAIKHSSADVFEVLVKEFDDPKLDLSNEENGDLLTTAVATYRERESNIKVDDVHGKIVVVHVSCSDDSDETVSEELYSDNVSPSYKTVKLLLESGLFNVQLATDFAIILRRYQVLPLLIEFLPDINVVGESMKTYLHTATGGSGVCDFRICQLLLENGADVKAEDVDGFTALELGIVKACFKCKHLKLFVRFGADTKRVHKSGVSVYQMAASKQDPCFTRCFYRSGMYFDEPRSGLKGSSGLSNSEKLLIAAQKMFFKGIKMNKPDLVKQAVKNGAEPLSCSVTIPYPLHFAVGKNYSKIVLLLLTCGVNPNCLDNNKEAPTALALRLGHFECWPTLLRFGACYEDGIKELSWFTSEVTSHYRDTAYRAFRREFEEFGPKAMFSAMKLSRKGLQVPRETVGRMFLEINTMFRIVRKGDIKGVNNLNNNLTVLIRNNTTNLNFCIYEIYHLPLNTINKNGHNLLAVAISKGHSQVAEQLMKIRVSMPLCC